MPMGVTAFGLRIMRFLAQIAPYQEASRIWPWGKLTRIGNSAHQQPGIFTPSNCIQIPSRLAELRLASRNSAPLRRACCTVQRCPKQIGAQQVGLAQIRLSQSSE